MTDITELFDSLLEQAGSIDIAEAEFKRIIHTDPELKSAYHQWCDEYGSSERNGFFDYCQDFKKSQDDIWDSLNNDYDEY